MESCITSQQQDCYLKLPHLKLSKESCLKILLKPQMLAKENALISEKAKSSQVVGLKHIHIQMHCQHTMIQILMMGLKQHIMPKRNVEKELSLLLRRRQIVTSAKKAIEKKCHLTKRQNKINT